MENGNISIIRIVDLRLSVFSCIATQRAELNKRTNKRIPILVSV